MKLQAQRKWWGLVAAVVLTATITRSVGGELSVPLPLGNGDFVVVKEDGLVTRRAQDGSAMWSAKTHGETGGVRPPHLLADSNRVYFSQDHGVTAISVADGAPLWRSSGPDLRLFLSDDLLLAAGRFSDTASWLVARHVADGKEAFRLPLPGDFGDAYIEDAQGLFLVQIWHYPTNVAFLLNRDGTVYHEFTNGVAAARSWAGGRLTLTGGEVVRLNTKGEIEWSIPFQAVSYMFRGGFVDVGGGQMIAYTYSPASDTGVQVMRFDPVHGGKVWQTYCQGLGVPHSVYNHRAEVVIGHDDWIEVISHGSGGEFVEELDAMGRSRQRKSGVTKMKWERVPRAGSLNTER